MKGTFPQENILAAIVLVILLIGFFLILYIAVQPSMNQIEWYEEIYIVKSGDTLWEIADEFCPEGVDKREWIYEVQTINNIHDSAIYPGQRIKVLVPAF